MERIMSTDERIRRAQEVYSRRNRNNSYFRYGTKEKNSKINFALLKKIISRIFICVLIYVGILTVKNKDYIFQEQFLNNVKEILNYNINFEKYYNKITNFLSFTEEDNAEQIPESNTEEENVNNVSEDENQSGIGGAVEEKIEEIANTENLSQMEIDSINIKNTYSLIKPLEGTITSRFGQRESTNPKVTPNHTGIDIAAATGMPIVAALDGVVEISSSEGDYGKHLRIKKDDIELIYAHCSKLLKSVGEEVKQGEVIAEVGSTGNATGPHLHFEIRKEERPVNPDLVLNF